MADPQSQESSTNDISVLQLINVVLRRRRVILTSALIIAAIFAIYTYLQPPRFTAKASFSPTNAEKSALPALAAQLGIGVTGGNNNSPAFYAALLKNYEILEPVVTATYTYSEDGKQKSGNYIDLVETKEGSPEGRKATAINELSKAMTVTTNFDTGVIEFTVTTRAAALSKQVADRILTELNNFNVEKMRSRASAERQFVEARLNTLKQELLAADRSLEQFLSQNRTYQTSPPLLLVRDRLQREVTSRQQIVMVMTQAFEQARIDEVRNTPVLSIVESPRTPLRPVPRQLLFKLIAGFLVGGVLGLFLAFIVEIRSRMRSVTTPDVEEFRQLQEEAWLDVRKPWRLIQGSARRKRMQNA